MTTIKNKLFEKINVVLQRNACLTWSCVYPTLIVSLEMLPETAIVSAAFKKE